MSGVGFAIGTPFTAKSLNPAGINCPGNMPFKVYKILALDRNRVHMVKLFKMKPCNIAAKRSAGLSQFRRESRVTISVLVSFGFAVSAWAATENYLAQSSNFGHQQFYYAAGPGFAVGLDGRWFHDGQPTRISVDADGRNLTIINEHGQRSFGYAGAQDELVIPSLGIRGHVGRKQQRIAWSNGTEWTREPTRDRFISSPSLDGRWFHDGRPTSISVTPDGRNLTIVNEFGQRSNGYIADRELVIPSLGIRGRLSHGERRISWSNGTEWAR